MLSSLKREEQRRQKLIDNFKLGVRTKTKRIDVDLATSNTRSSNSRSITKNNNQFGKTEAKQNNIQAKIWTIIEEEKGIKNMNKESR